MVDMFVENSGSANGLPDFRGGLDPLNKPLSIQEVPTKAQQLVWTKCVFKSSGWKKTWTQTYFCLILTKSPHPSTRSIGSCKVVPMESANQRLWPRPAVSVTDAGRTPRDRDKPRAGSTVSEMPCKVVRGEGGGPIMWLIFGCFQK